MPEYFYTLDIGAHHGKKLSRLAADLCRDDDVEAFAAQLLREAIDRAEEAYRKDLEEIGKEIATDQERLKPDRLSYDGDRDLNGEDDGIPF